MFKKFDEKENVSNCIQLKTSVIKGIKNQLVEQFPGVEPWLNQIMPKKDPVKMVRCHEHVEILTVNGELLFFRQREGPFYPTLRLLHKYPFMLPRQQVDKGAIKFVLSGANIMCPGLTSPGAQLFPAAAETVVAIMAEGKQHALCVGVMKLSAEDIGKKGQKTVLKTFGGKKKKNRSTPKLKGLRLPHEAISREPADGERTHSQAAGRFRKWHQLPNVNA